MILPQLPLDVVFEIKFSAKWLAAMVARIGQDALMLIFLVHSEVYLLGETLITLIASVGLLSGMCPHVVEKLAHALLGVTAAIMLALE